MDDLSSLDRTVDDLIAQALQEDIPERDVTTDLLIPASAHTHATIVAKEPGILAGGPLVQRVFSQIDPSVEVTLLHRDGAWVENATVVIRLYGNARSILTAERVALNFLQHLSGIASLTYRVCQAVQHFQVKILDTRKTIPGLRQLQKWAVRIGGGTNHRLSLSDGILIKDNHLAVLRHSGVDISQACRQAKSKGKGLAVCVEVESLDEIQQALEGKPDILLLDNMSVQQIREAVHLIQGRALTEVSGGVTLNNVGEIAATGVNSISLGGLTHSAPAMDFSLHIVPGLTPT